MKPLRSSRAAPISGDIRVPGDKSISHRALLIAGMAVGESVIKGLLAGDDVIGTARALAALGVEIKRAEEAPDSPGAPWRVFGRGVGGLGEPDGILDMGNSGTGARLLAGMLATHPFTSMMTGDKSLRARPMERVMAPLRRMGAEFQARSGGRLPLTINGARSPVPIVEELSVPSAQVKSAILLAALNTPGKTTVIEPRPTRDHSELLLRHFGVEVESEPVADGARAITVTGYPEITGARVTVPGDISSAAFPLVAALLVPDSALTLRGVGINPLRAGLLETLGEMGAAITVENRNTAAGEPVADLTVKSARLRGVTVPAERTPSMIDEYPILAIAAAAAEGVTRFEGVGELRVKESDRLAAIAEGLTAAGVKVEAGEDSLAIYGDGRPPAGGATIAARMDHRIAMAFLVLGAIAEQPVTIDDGATIDTSFPGFESLMTEIGLDLNGGGARP